MLFQLIRDKKTTRAVAISRVVTSVLLDHVIRCSFKHLNTEKYLPWISKSIKLQMKKRKSLYDKAKQTQAASGWREYRKA